MSNFTEVNEHLIKYPYLGGYEPSSKDAILFRELFGDNVKVMQWAARMATYYPCEREEITHEKPDSTLTMKN